MVKISSEYVLWSGLMTLLPPLPEGQCEITF